MTTTAYPTIARLTTGGQLDTSFGGTGWFRVTVPGSTGSGKGIRVAVQADGKVLLLGTTSFVVGTNKNQKTYAWPFVARYNADGTTDTGFGTSGYAVDSRFAESDSGSTSKGLAVQSTGKILVAWQPSSHPWQITRLLSNGTIDTSFPTSFVATDTLMGMGVDAGDAIVAVGNHPTPSGTDVQVVRYGVDGAVDTGFGSGGTVLIHAIGSQSTQTDPGFDPAGRIALGIRLHNLVGTTYHDTATVVRLLGDGSLDTAFGTGGIGAPLDLGSNGTWPRGLGVASDGGILLGGQFNTSQFLARYSPN